MPHPTLPTPESRARSAAVMRAEQSRVRALLARDHEALDGLLADELVYTHLSGRVDGKRGFIDGVGSRVGYRAIETQDLDVRLYEELRIEGCGEALDVQVTGAMAVLTGVYRFEATVAPDPAPQVHVGRVTQVWRMAPSGWKLCASHGCRADG